jgi:hypothetical protein
MKDEGGMSVQGIAKKTGKSHSTITRFLNFARCPEEVRRAVDQKQISLLVLETLQEITEFDDFMLYFKMAAANGVTAPVARMWVEDWQKTKAGTYYAEDGVRPPANVEMENKPIYMTCECCLQPVEMKLIKNLITCPACRKKVRGQ